MNPLNDIYGFDAAVVAGVAADMLRTDYVRTMEVRHVTGTNLDLGRGVIVPSAEVTRVENCILRGGTRRQNQTTKQINNRLQAVQSSDVNTYDISIEVPKQEGLVIDVNDTLRDVLSGDTYTVTAVDTATLATRYRVGCRQVY